MRARHQVVEQADTIDDLVRVYVEQATVVDAVHIDLRQQADQQSLPAVIRVADRAYATYTNTLND